MLLVLDVGNTNVTAGIVRDGSLLARRRAATRSGSTADELEVLIDGLLRLDDVSLADVSAICGASVVPRLTEAVREIAARRGLPLLIADAATVPIPIRVDRPSEVGADRLVNAFAAQRLHGAPAIVLDFGTATTFDVIAPDGAYIGGAIAPGLELGLDALAARTAKLPRVELRAPERVIGRDTVSAIQAGAVVGYQELAAGLLDRTRSELAAEQGLEPGRIPAILTGGLSGAPWARGIRGIDAIEPDLTLHGLAMLYAETIDHASATPTVRDGAAASR